MKRIYGQYGWSNFVQLSKKQLENEFVSPAKAQLAWGILKDNKNFVLRGGAPKKQGNKAS
jgi:hypothetical protein